MKRIKILFFINSLRGGGAERSLVNLVNNIDKVKYDITVLTLINKGIYINSLDKSIKYKYIFSRYYPGIKSILKLFSPKYLYKLFIKGDYDIVMSFLQGITTRIVAGAPKKQIIVTRIAGTFEKEFHVKSYSSFNEMIKCYKRYDKVVGVSKDVSQSFINDTNITENVDVLRNIHDIDYITSKSQESVDFIKDKKITNFITAGSFFPVKGYKRLLKCVNNLKEKGYYFHLYILGDGEEKYDLEEYVANNNLNNCVIFLGYQRNPYKYICQADMFICSSYTEGFSGTVSESVILGVPVLTTDCASMKEILGYKNEYGIVVDNNNEALLEGIKQVLDNKLLLSDYKEKVKERSTFFSISNSINMAEVLFDSLICTK